MPILGNNYCALIHCLPSVTHSVHDTKLFEYCLRLFVHARIVILVITVTLK